MLVARKLLTLESINSENRFPRVNAGFLLLQLHTELTWILSTLLFDIVFYYSLIYAYTANEVAWRPNNILFLIHLG